MGINRYVVQKTFNLNHGIKWERLATYQAAHLSGGCAQQHRGLVPWLVYYRLKLHQSDHEHRRRYPILIHVTYILATYNPSKGLLHFQLIAFDQSFINLALQTLNRGIYTGSIVLIFLFVSKQVVCQI